MDAKTLIPVIRPLSKILAEDIIGVQPMVNPFSKNEYPYQLNILELNNRTIQDVIPMIDWCTETFNENEWASKAQFFAFTNEKAYTWFLLKWA